MELKRVFIVAILILISFSLLPARAEKIRSIHVFVALCDRVHQGIVSSSPRLENGEDPKSNLYWGAYYGIKSYFGRNRDWKLIKRINNPNDDVLEKVIFLHSQKSIYLIADAYRGRKIKQAILDFLSAAAGQQRKEIQLDQKGEKTAVPSRGGAELICYIGHNGLMDFSLDSYPEGKNKEEKRVIILACKSKFYFREALEMGRAYPLLWTTGLMAPEAYTLKAALDGWMNKESEGDIRIRAAKAYHKFQKCGLKAALRLLVTGW
jgi:hypothetical protein